MCQTNFVIFHVALLIICRVAFSDAKLIIESENDTTPPMELLEPRILGFRCWAYTSYCTGVCANFNFNPEKNCGFKFLFFWTECPCTKYGTPTTTPAPVTEPPTTEAIPDTTTSTTTTMAPFNCLDFAQECRPNCTENDFSADAGCSVNYPPMSSNIKICNCSLFGTPTPSSPTSTPNNSSATAETPSTPVQSPPNNSSATAETPSTPVQSTPNNSSITAETPSTPAQSTPNNSSTTSETPTTPAQSTTTSSISDSSSSSAPVEISMESSKSTTMSSPSVAQSESSSS